MWVGTRKLPCLLRKMSGKKEEAHDTRFVLSYVDRTAKKKIILTLHDVVGHTKPHASDSLPLCAEPPMFATEDKTQSHEQPVRSPCPLHIVDQLLSRACALALPSGSKSTAQRRSRTSWAMWRLWVVSRCWRSRATCPT